MSLASPVMDQDHQAEVRARVDAAPKRKWSARRTVALVVVASAVLWAIIIVTVSHLL